ncbi:terminase [Lactobacillus kunkeei]|uniref:terminase small subunit n=1 Tax=Apilactobacillus kunkeei TaxID=148814 RepID=UPI0013644349|nr:terminase small subunit [Apilactobacillus kunkeei]NBI01349.1 terminase [Apilactobacillus kunkeei]
MSKQSKEKQEQARKQYEQGKEYKEISRNLDVSINTIKSWRTRNKWQRKQGANSANKNAPTENIGAKVQMHKNNATDERWKEFCELYLRTFNATKAYMAVYKVKYNTATVNGSRLLRNAKVQEYLSKLKKAHAAELFIDTQDLLEEEVKIAKASLYDAIDIQTIRQERVDAEGNQVTDVNGEPIIDVYDEIYMKDKDKIDWSTIAELHRGKDGLVVKQYDKHKAIEMLLKQLPNEKNELELEKLRLQNKLIDLKTAALDTDNDEGMSQMDRILQALDAADDEYHNEE